MDCLLSDEGLSAQGGSDRRKSGRKQLRLVPASGSDEEE